MFENESSFVGPCALIVKKLFNGVFLLTYRDRCRQEKNLVLFFWPSVFDFMSPLPFD